MKKPTINDYRLYFVTDPLLHGGYAVLEQVKLALQGGVKIIQVREKNLPPADYLKLAADALKLTRAHGAFLIINDSVEVAAAAGADGIHLGQEDTSVAEARKLLGQDIIIGVSVKTVEEAVRAEKDSADYLAVSGVFPTSTKKDLGYYPGLDGVKQIRQNTHLPVIGIGGINLRNCRSVIESGAHGVAVVTAITMSGDIPHTCRTFFELMKPREM